MAFVGTDTASTNFDKTVQVLINRVLEDELLPTLPHLMPGLYRKATFVKGTNSTMRFLRIPNLAISDNGGTVTPGTAPWLEEGVTPAAQEFTFGYEEFTSYQAGQRIAISDVALMESPLDLASEGAKLVARQAAEVVDLNVARKLVAGTNVLYAGSGNAATTDVGAGDTLTGSLVRRAVQTMKGDNIPKFNDGTYRAIVNPSVVFDFEEDANVGGWLDAQRYRGSEAILDGELGKYAGVRFYESSRAWNKTAGGAGGVDVFSTYISGPESFAFGDWGTITTHTVLPGGQSDELAQRMSIGWKGFIGAMLIDEAGPRYLRIESSSDL